jgi:hypothetical protein
VHTGQKGTKWTTVHLKIRAKLGIPPGSKPLAEAGIKIDGIPPDDLRALDLIEVAWASRPPGQRVAEGFYADIGQNCNRQPWGALRCLTSRSVIVDFEQRKVLSGVHHMLLMGMPSEFDFTELTEAQRVKLSGQGFFIPSVASVLLAVVLQPRSPWLEVASKPKKLKVG